MKIYAKIIYSTNEYNTLCFRHAVIQALQGKDVAAEVEEDFYFCELCLKEERKVKPPIKNKKPAPFEGARFLTPKEVKEIWGIDIDNE